MRRARATARSGDFLLSVVFLAALTLLIANDFLLKRAAPGALSGKLSDVAGPIVASLILVAAIELVVRCFRPASSAKPWWFVAASLLVVAAFAGIKMTELGAQAYATSNTWVFQQFATVSSAVGWQVEPVQVSVVADSVDVLVALLAIPAASWVGFHWRAEGIRVQSTTPG
jgi:hypothetical protein